MDEHRWWRTQRPETAPTAAAALARLVVTDLRARGTACPDEVTAWDISAGLHQLRCHEGGVQALA